MERQEQKSHETLHAVEIDYQQVDVSRIMDQVKKAAAERPPAPSRSETPQNDDTAGQPGGAASGPGGGGPPAGFKEKIKGKVLKLMAPFFPVIRLFALPLHEELNLTNKNLHETNRRIDFLYQRLEDLDQSMEYIKLLHNLSHNIVVELTKLSIEHDGLKTKARILQKDLEFLEKREKTLEKHVVK